jgi:hypothetical protein
MNPDRLLERRARRKNGVFTLADALECGIARSTVYERVRTGQYRQLQPGVFAIAAVADSRRARVRAAQLAVRDSVVSHRSAGELHGLPGCARYADIDILVHRDRPSRLRGVRGVRLHRSSRLDERHVTEVHGIPATSVERTLCDLAGVLDPSALRGAVTHVVRHALTTPNSISQVTGALGPFSGKRVLLAVLAELSPLEGATRSELESRFLELTSKAGIPPTQINNPVRDAEGMRRVIDAVYLPEHIPVELDGERWHGLRTDRTDDRRRENAVVLSGEWRSFLRFTWWQVLHEPDEVVRTVQLALDAARASPPDGD